MLTRVVLILCLLLPFAVEGCNRAHIQTGQSNVSSASSPAGISSSAQVVRVEATPVAIAPNGSADAVLTLSISPGFHINANPATFPYLIATEVRHVPNPGECIETGKPVYPPAASKQFAFAEHPLAVYEGEVRVKLPVRLLVPGKCRPLTVTVRVQACDHEKCYPPATLDASIPIEVK